jgi:hypothetical protein
VATLDRERLYADHTLNVLFTVDDLVDIRAVLAVLNSTLVNWYFRKKHIDINIKGMYLTAVPLPRALTDPSGASTAAPRLAELADSLLSLRTQGVQERTADDASRLQRQAETVDRQIDRLVYELYGLSDAEIALVEAV